MNQGIASLLWFVLIIALIPLALKLLKRTPMGGAAARGVMRTVAVLPLAPNQRLITVEVGTGDDRCWLVLGVTAQQITTLHTMAPQDEVPAPQAPGFDETPFGQLIKRLKHKGGPDER
jgi:flagellar protein FliO/FliZ